MKLRALLFCVLSGLLAAPTLATTVTINSTDNFVTKFNQVSAGDTVSVGAGTFNLTAPVQVPSGVTITGAGVSASHINFTLTGTNSTSYGFVIAGGAQNVTITGLDLSSNHGLIEMANGTGYSNIIIANNSLQYGAGQFTDGTLVFGIYGTVPNNSLKIEYNYFHDSPGTIRNWCVWYANNSNFDYNVFFNVNDGGQIDNPSGTVSFSYNYGTELHRMGQEVALDAQSTFICKGNVFYNYLQPYNDTEGVSIIGVSGPVDIEANYFDACMPGYPDATQVPQGSSVWGQKDSGGTNRFGYAIEGTGSNPSYVKDNTIIGPWADDVSSDIANLNVDDNSVYGVALWGAFDGEPGPYGYGSCVTSGNTINNDVSLSPAPPSNTFAGPTNFTGTLSSTSGTTVVSTGTGNTGTTGTGDGGYGLTSSGGSSSSGSTGSSSTGSSSTGSSSTGSLSTGSSSTGGSSTGGSSTGGSSTGSSSTGSSSTGSSSTGSSSTGSSSTGSSSTGSSSTGSSSTGSSSTGSSSTGSSSSGGSTSSGGGSTGPVAQVAPGTPALPLTGVSITVTSDNTVTVNWLSPNPDITSVTVTAISTVGRQNFPPTTSTGNVTSMNIGALHPGWLIDFTVTATGANGQKYVSQPVTVSMPGNSVAPWQGLLWGGISVLQTNPFINN